MDINYYTPVIGLSYIIELIINNNTIYYCVLCNLDINNEKEIRAHCIKTNHNNNVFNKDYSSLNLYLLKDSKINTDIVYKSLIYKNIYNIINKEEERIKLYYIIYKYEFENNNYDIDNIKKIILENIDKYKHLNEINWIDSHKILLHDINIYIRYYNVINTNRELDLSNINNQTNKFKHYKIIHNHIEDPRLKNNNYLLKLSNKNKEFKFISKFKDYNTYIKEKYKNI